MAVSVLVDGVRATKLQSLYCIVRVNVGKRQYTEEFVDPDDVVRLMRAAAEEQQIERALLSLFAPEKFANAQKSGRY
jgi:hypothetical protein